MILLCVVALPLLGAAVARRSLSKVFQFPPPSDIPSDYLHFSWIAVTCILAPVAIVAAAWIRCLRASSKRVSFVAEFRRPCPFPRWGWGALIWTITWWVFAWNRWPWFEDLQRYTFFPLWFGFIVTVNGLTQRRGGSCLMRRVPRAWLALFVVSAAFWWIFEWLNRFVWNWHYRNVEDFSGIAYAVNATVCFSTVLPAVAAVAEFIAMHPRWVNRVAAGPAWRWLTLRRTAILLSIVGTSALFLTGIVPRLFYPALWTAPLILLLCEPILARRREGLAYEIARGDWTRAATWMTAALVCGFFWELWNWRSLAKWVYTVPGVERWHLFEMPVLGYAGYLPFGLECLLIADWLAGINANRTRA